VSEFAPSQGPLRQPVGPAERPPGERELFVRYARKEGRTVAILRTVDRGGACVVEAEVFPHGATATQPIRPGPYTFPGVQQATEFVSEAVEALMILGCDID
jgi:hypothetical protein